MGASLGGLAPQILSPRLELSALPVVLADPRPTIFLSFSLGVSQSQGGMHL